jgi:hypothetical protein
MTGGAKTDSSTQGPRLDGTDNRPEADSQGYRYPGSAPFQDSDLDRQLFNGRETEAEEVLHTILSSDLLVVYAASGMGKTSLLKAGVMQGLRDRGYWPVTVRLNVPKDDPVTSIHEQIKEADRDDETVEVALAPDAPVNVDESLWTLLASLEVWRDDDLQRMVLVMDQFEELFTLEWDPSTREALIRELGEVARGARNTAPGLVPVQSRNGLPTGPQLKRQVKLVLVIREDSLGELEALSHDIPQILNNRFRLSPLRRPGAESALNNPAALEDERLEYPCFKYDDAAIECIVKFLEKRTSLGAASGAIDPSQLQIIGQHIERVILPEKISRSSGEVVVNSDDFGGKDGLEDILREFYRRTLDSFSDSEQKSIRNLCEQGLINSWRRRRSIDYREILKDYQVSRATLDALVDKRLLRAEPRVDTLYFELAHDSLIDAVLSERDRRRANRRRHRLVVASSVLACVIIVMAILFGYVVGTGGTRGTLVVGQPRTEPLSSPDDVAEFDVDSLDSPAFVVVDDFLGDVQIAVTQRGARRDHNQFPAGSPVPERMLLVPGPQEEPTQQVSVSAVAGSEGTFEISLVKEDPRSLEDALDDENIIAEPGDSLVLRVDQPQGRSVITVTPSSFEGGGVGGTETNPGLDAEIEVIDPDGVGTRVDSGGPGEPERAVVGGSNGSYYVVIRGSGASTGQFTLDAQEVEELKPDQEVSGQETTGTFLFRKGEELRGDYMVRVKPAGGLDAVVQLVDPAGGTTVWDTAGRTQEEALILPHINGEFLVTVSGRGGTTGEFSLSVDTSVAEPLNEGIPVAASGLTIFRVEPSEGSRLQFRTERGSDSDVTISVYGRSRDPKNWVTQNGPSTLVGDESLIVVQPRGGRPEFRASLTSFETIEVANPRESEERLSKPTAFDLNVRPGGFLAAVWSPDNDDAVFMDVYTASGVHIDGTSGESDRVLVGNGAEGVYTVVARSAGEGEVSFEGARVSEFDVGAARVEKKGEIRDPGGASVYKVQPSEGGVWIVAVKSTSDIEPTLVAYDQQGRWHRAPRAASPTRSYTSLRLGPEQGLFDRDAFFVVVGSKDESGKGSFTLIVEKDTE